MKKLLSAVLFSLFTTVCSAELVVGYAAVLSGPRWTITNVNVAAADKFYVGLSTSSVNYMALDLLVNAANLTRFNVYGDYGTRVGGTSHAYFVGYGYTLGSDLHLNLRDELNANWNCFLNSNMSGDCTVYTSASRLIGSIHLSWNP